MIRFWIAFLSLLLLFRQTSGLCDPEVVPATAKDLKELVQDASSKVTTKQVLKSELKLIFDYMFSMHI